MTTTVSLPLDQGFLRRCCPTCQREFKWHHASAEDRSDDEPPVCFCPYCGESAPLDQWWTEEQAEYVRSIAALQLVNELHQRFAHVGSGQAAPLPLHEPHDMSLIASPCHPAEPIKIRDEWNEAIYCIVCGRQFAV